MDMENTHLHEAGAPAPAGPASSPRPNPPVNAIPAGTRRTWRPRVSSGWGAVAVALLIAGSFVGGTLHGPIATSVAAPAAVTQPAPQPPAIAVPAEARQ